jgi:hypothetical protein
MSHGRERFTGTWMLLSQVTHYPDGRVVPSRGLRPAGILMYDALGNMSVQLMRTDEHANEYTDLTRIATALGGYHAYFGTYEVDTAQQIVINHVIGAAYIGYRDTVQVRRYQFSPDGNTLTLQAVTPGENSVRVLIWQRMTGAWEI